jgi:transcriptional regulator with XRE-family HTH domain
MEAFGKALKRLRHERGISQQKLADALNLQRTTITNYESGRGLPGLELFVDVVKFFGVSSDVLLGLSGDVDAEHIKPKQQLPTHFVIDGSHRRRVRKPEMSIRTPEEQAHIAQLESKVNDLLKMAGHLSEEIQKVRSVSH